MHLMNTYARLPVAFERGEGAWLWDTEGRQYLDALSGIAVSGLGHAHPRLVAAIAAQAARLIHSSNLYRIPEQEQLAATLSRLADMDRVFFCNSGCEANEAAIKLARLHGHQRGIDQPAIVVMEKSFHGRTIATLSATGSRKVQAGFEPLLGGFVRVPYNDRHVIEQVAAHNPGIVAVLVEPIQGEGGVNVPDDGYLAYLRQLCNERGWLLMLDEVQSGMGRTGKWWAIQHWNTEPDIVCIAKGVASGMPLGAMVARKSVMTWPAGAHGNTYGGNPISCTAALETIRLLEGGYMHNAETVGKVALEILEEMQTRHPSLGNVRGKGLMIGVEFVNDKTTKERGVDIRNQVIHTAFEHGLLLLGCGRNTIRITPPLCVTEPEIIEGLAIFDHVITEAERAAGLL